MRVSGRDLVRRPVLLVSTLGLAATALTAVVTWPTPTPAGRAAHLSVLESEVEVLAAGTEEAVPAGAGQRLGVGDSVTTDASGVAEIRYPDGSVTHLDGATTFTLVELAESPRRTRVRLDVGRAWHRVRSLTRDAGERFEVVTDAAIAGVRGTTFVTSCDADTCRVLVVEGAVDVRTRDGAFLDLVEGEAVVVDRRTGAVDRVEMVALADPDLTFAPGAEPPSLALAGGGTEPSAERPTPAVGPLLERTVAAETAPDATGDGTPDRGDDPDDTGDAGGGGTDDAGGEGDDTVVGEDSGAPGGPPRDDTPPDGEVTKGDGGDDEDRPVRRDARGRGHGDDHGHDHDGTDGVGHDHDDDS